MAKKKTEEEVKPVEKKLYGIVEKVVESVRDGSIDIHHVFTREYASQFGDLEDREVLVKFSHNWYDSLPYINSVHEDDRSTEFGVVRLAEEDYEVNGAEVACYVLKNIFADFIMTGEMFMHPMMNPVGVIPHILCDPDDLWRRKEDFLYFYDKDQEPIQVSAQSNLISEDLNMIDPQDGTDLLQLVEVIQSWDEEVEKDTFDAEDDTPPSTEPLGIYGFMASLIHAMFKDTIRRSIFNTEWYNENFAYTTIFTISNIKIVNSDKLPTHLHIPANAIFPEYLDRMLGCLRYRLMFEDIEYDDNPRYTMERMLEIEIEQYTRQQSSKLWKALPIKVQEMLLKYHLSFIKFMQKNLDMEEVGVPEVCKEEKEEKAEKSFSLLTDTCHAEHKEVKVISELRAACKGTAVGLWKVIRENEALDYLGTKGMQTSKIYRAIVDYFGDLPYSERNFRDARDKK